MNFQDIGLWNSGECVALPICVKYEMLSLVKRVYSHFYTILKSKTDIIGYILGHAQRHSKRKLGW